MVLALAWPSSVGIADEAPDWEATPLAGRASHVFTPASGALFAQVDNDLYFGDDACATWADLALGVDGKNLYAATDQGVFRMRLTP